MLSRKNGKSYSVVNLVSNLRAYFKLHVFLMMFRTDYNECAKDRNPCLNGATCDNRNGTFNCICPPGWKGAFCDAGNPQESPVYMMEGGDLLPEK